jgi:glyoxylase-like metal-dependent hydrolase (beta-lactamase superfamily II)
MRALLAAWLLSAGALFANACGAAGNVVQLRPGVYMVQGARGAVDSQTLGRVGNAGFIVGEQGVLAIDTGTSHRHGEALLAAIRSVTDRPVRLALVTHAQKDFLFGATAFQAQGIPVMMHRAAAQLMRSRCERCLAMLKRTLGEEEMRGSAVPVPDREFDGSQRLDVIGRPIELIYLGHSSGPGDVAVLDVQSGVLFAGGLLEAQRIPDAQDGETEGWLRALQALRQVPAKVIVPGHGPATDASAIEPQERYLRQLDARVRELLQAGAALSAVPEAAALPEFAGWDQYDTQHPRNASALFVRLQREQLQQKK